MKKKLRKHPASLPPFQDGQIWQMGDSSLRISQVGKTLVHYKHYKDGNKRPPVLLSNKGVLERFLRENDAILHPEPSRLTPATEGRAISFGRKSCRPAEAKEN